MNKTVLCKKTSRSLNVTETRSGGSGRRLRAKLSGVTALSLFTILTFSSFAPGTPLQATEQISLVPDTVHSIQVSKSKISKKNKVRLYPDAKQQVLFFSADGEERKVYQLYLFDMDGKLVHQASIRNHETTVLTDITLGNYLFEVFSNDDRIENGQLSVR